MNRRYFLLLSMLACSMAAWCLAAAQDATAAMPPAKPSLKDILQNDLHAVFPAQIAFINKVVHLVNIGVLPRDLVLGTYDWARHENSQFPFPFFEFALRARARKIGVIL